MIHHPVGATTLDAVTHAVQQAPEDEAVSDIRDAVALDQALTGLATLMPGDPSVEARLRDAAGRAHDLYRRRAGSYCPCSMSRWFHDTQKQLVTEAERLLGTGQLVVSVSWSPLQRVARHGRRR